MMRIAKQVLPLCLLATLLAGCATNINNLTSGAQSPSPTGFYTLEAGFNSSQQSLRWETIRPYALVGDNAYPMRLTQLMTNRWEALVPVPPGQTIVYYRFKFDYECNGFGGPAKDSKLSPTFRLQILDK